MDPVAHFEQEHYTVALFGGHGSFEDWLLFAKTKTKYGLQNIIIPPAAGKPGFQTIQNLNTKLLIVKDTDGMNIPPGHAIAIRTKDCATAVAYNPLTGKLAAAHIGRHGLMPIADCCACGFTTVASLLNAVAPRGTNCSRVTIYVTGSICGSCYRFDRPEAAGTLATLQSRYPGAIVDGTGFDQVTAITSECVGRGVPKEHIHHDGLCTVELKDLTSYRTGDKNSNTVVVIHHG